MKYKQFVVYSTYFYNSKTENQRLYPSIVDMFSDNYKVGIDSIIFSAYNFNNDCSNKIIERLRPKCCILGDSGGFQILSGVTEYTDEFRKKTFEWLENTCDYSMLLDLPPYGIDFDYAMGQSKDNFEYFKNNLKGKTKFLNILHGNRLFLLQKWFEMMKQFDCFNGGWALGSIKRTSPEINLFLVLASLTLLYKEGILETMKEDMYLHILGTTSLQILICSFYFLHRINFKGIFSFDSSAITQVSSLTGHIVSYYPRKIIRHVEHPELICNCSICQCKDFVELKKENSLFNYVQLYNHNYLKINEAVKLVYEVTKGSKDDFDELLTPYSKSMLNVIDEIITNKNDCMKLIEKQENFIKKLMNNSESIVDLF